MLKHTKCKVTRRDIAPTAIGAMLLLASLACGKTQSAPATPETADQPLLQTVPTGRSTQTVGDWAQVVATSGINSPQAAVSAEPANIADGAGWHPFGYQRDPAGNLRPDLWRKAVAEYLEMPVAASLTAETESKTPGIKSVVPLVQVYWNQIGPAPIRWDSNPAIFWSGEVTDIAIDPRGATDQVIYIAANDGGVWKSTDGGNTWVPKTDFMPSLSMGAVTLDRNNPSIVYAGTGNIFNNGFFKGIGIYKSINGGDNWSILNPGGIFNSIGINRIVAAGNIMLVATRKGLYRSVDGGLNFGSNSPQFNNGIPFFSGVFVSDLKVDTASATTIYAGVSRQGLFRSTDSGATFPAAGNLFNNPGGPAAGSFINVHFDQSTQPDNQTIYATAESTNCQTLIVLKSVNAGGNWSSSSPIADGSYQCGYDDTIGVDPQSPNRVYIGLVGLFYYTDGGGTFGNGDAAGVVHADHHAIAFSPPIHFGAVPTRAYVGEDGGIATGTGTSFANLNNGLATTLFRFIDIGRNSAANNAFSYGGLQDNGAVVRRSGFAGLEWHLNTCCDGFGVAVDPNNGNNAFSSLNGGYNRTSNGGDTWAGVPGSGLTNSIYRFATDPNSSSVLYVISVGCEPQDACGSIPCFFCPGSRLWQSTDGGSTFTLIHSFPTAISAIGTVKTDSNVMWVGLVNGRVQRTANVLAGTASVWTPLTVTGAFGLPVGGVAIDPTDTSRVVVVYQGFTTIPAPFRTKHAFLTTDNGATWSDIGGTDGNPSQNLPDIPLNDVVIDPGTPLLTIIVASDAGVLRSTDLGTTWQVLGFGLPTVQCTSLALDTSASPGLLRVASYGRSVFQLAVTNVPVISIAGDVSFLDTCVGDTNFATLEVCNIGSTDLEVGAITSSDSQFGVVTPSSGFPVTISPDFCFPFRVRFSPTAVGSQQTTFTVTSNDPLSPTVTVRGFGKGVGPSITAFMVNSNNFGDVCRGAFRDQNLTINNSGGCTLVVSSITSSSSQFLVPVVMNFPIVIQPGDSVTVPIRFQPTSLGPKTGMIIIASNAPLSPKLVSVSGNVPPGDARVVGSTDFGDVCAGTQAEKTISVCNVGKCDLTVTNVAFLAPCPDFVLVNNPFPAVVSPDSCLDVVIRFTPTSCGTHSCLLQIGTDDPDTPVIILTVTANAPCASIDVPPGLAFPPEVIQNAGPCNTAEPFPISNTGECNLVISNIWLSGTNAGDFSLSGLPSFPIILEPGHIVGEGDFQVVFAPTVVARERRATLNVTYISDPFSGATTTVSRELCGEGVLTGARVLVMHAGVPLDSVERIHLQRVVGNRNKPQLDTSDVARDLPLVTVMPDPPCEPFQYHREYGTVSNPIQLLPGNYQVTVQAIINGKRKSWTVGFDVSTCDFNPTVVVNFP